MPSAASARRPAAQPPRPEVDALLAGARRLRGGVEAVRDGGGGPVAGPEDHWRRALCALAARHLDEVGDHLVRLRDGPHAEPARRRARQEQGPTGSATWDLAAGTARWSPEVYGILGRDPAAGPLTLDDLPSCACPADRPALAAMIAGGLIDGAPLDGEFRVPGSGGQVRDVRLRGECVRAPHGGVSALWAVLRDVSGLRRADLALAESQDRLRHRDTEHRLAVDLQRAALPRGRGPLRLANGGGAPLEVHARHLPASLGPLVGGDFHEALDVPGGAAVLGVGALAGHGPGAVAAMASVRGALRALALAGTRPGPLLGLLNRMLDTPGAPGAADDAGTGAPDTPLGSAVCCRYEPGPRTLVWAGAGHPAPLLLRGGTGRALTPPEGVLLGAAPDSVYGHAEERLRPGDLLLLHTRGLVSGHARATGPRDLLALAPRLAGARTARDCLRTVEEAFGARPRQDDACVLVAQVAA